MTLLNDIREQKTGMSVAPGVDFDTAIGAFVVRASKAINYVLDRNVMAMAASVSLSKPSSILQALPYLRLPYESVFVEFEPSDLRDALADLGSPNLRPEDAAGHLVKSGFLVRLDEQRQQLIIEYVHRMRSSRGDLCEVCSVRGLFSVAGIGDRPDIEAAPSRVQPHEKSKGRMREHLKLINSDPKEALAYEEYRDRLDWDFQPDMEAISDAVARLKGPAAAAAIHTSWLGEMSRLIFNSLIPGLLLLNSRNAVSVEQGESFEKLNRQRAKKGRAPLLPSNTVRMNLVPRRHGAADETGVPAGSRRAALVVGHFKVRSRSTGEAGIFWWSPHARRGHGTPMVKTRIVTA